MVDIDSMTDAVRSTRLSSIKAERRRSSAHRRRESASGTTPRQSVSCGSQGLTAIDNLSSNSHFAQLPLPESPKLSPLPFSPITERRAAFSDESLSPISSLSFSTLPSPTFSTAFSTVSKSSTRTTRLQPRSPQTPSFADGLSGHREPRLKKQDDSIQSPSGVRIKFPLVFPSRPPPSPRPPQSPAFDHDQEDDTPTPSDDEFSTPTMDSSDYFANLPPPLPPKSEFTSPFPPPLVSELSAYPRSRPQPQLRLDLSFIGSPAAQRKFSNSSSYRPSPPDHLVGTPGTIALFRTGTHTSTSTYASNVFSEAFAGQVR